MQFITISTVNYQIFSERAFQFTLTPGMILQPIIIEQVMGLIDSVLPVLRPSRMKIVDALRATWKHGEQLEASEN